MRRCVHGSQRDNIFIFRWRQDGRPLFGTDQTRKTIREEGSIRKKGKTMRRNEMKRTCRRRRKEGKRTAGMHEPALEMGR